MASSTETCVECGSSENVVDHHVNYEEDETVPACRSCHIQIHNNPNHRLHPEDERPDDSGFRPRISPPVSGVVGEIMEEYGLNTYDQAIRQLARQADYDI